MSPARHLIATSDTDTADTSDTADSADSAATAAAAPRLRWRHHTLIVPGASQGGPAHLLGTVRQLLIEAEQEGLHTVLLAPRLTDLEPPTALVCRYVATDDDDVQREAVSRYGAERVLRVPSAETADLPRWVGKLPRPQARTLQRRIRRTARRFGPARALHAMITERRRPERRTR